MIVQPVLGEFRASDNTHVMFVLGEAYYFYNYGDASTTHQMAAALDGSSIVAGVLAAHRSFALSMTATGAMSIALSRIQQLASVIPSASNLGAAFSKVKNLAAVMLAEATVAVSVSALRGLSGIVAISSSIATMLGRTQQVKAEVSSSSMIIGRVTRSRLLASSISASGLVASSARLIRGMVFSARTVSLTRATASVTRRVAATISVGGIFEAILTRIFPVRVSTRPTMYARSVPTIKAHAINKVMARTTPIIKVDKG